MNILFFSFNIGPSAIRIIKQSLSMAKIDAISNIYISFYNDSNIQQNNRILEEPKIKLHRSVIYADDSVHISVFKKIKILFQYTRDIIPRFKSKQIDIIVVNSVGVLPLAVLLKLLWKTQLIYNPHELETHKNGLTGIRQKLAQFSERLFIKHADAVIVVGESIADWYENTYRIKRPTVVLNSPPKQDRIFSNYFRDLLNIKENQTIFLYIGFLQPGRGIELMLDAFKNRTDNNTAVMVFMGPGILTSLLKEHAQQYKNIYYMPPVPPEHVPNYAASADINLALVENTCLNEYYCMPNKLFQGGMAGLATVTFPLKDMSEYLLKYNAGIVLDKECPVALNKLIDELLTKNLADMKENAYLAACENSWEVQESKLMHVFKNLLN